MNKFRWMSLIFVKLVFIKFGFTLPNTIKIGKKIVDIRKTSNKFR